jgi:hypothetical protein
MHTDISLIHSKKKIVISLIKIDVTYSTQLDDWLALRVKSNIS